MTMLRNVADSVSESALRPGRLIGCDQEGPLLSGLYKAEA